MKRKAMLMGMAVMTGLPGWSIAKSNAKAVGGAHSYAGGLEAQATIDQVETGMLPPLSDETGAVESASSKAGRLLAQIKSLLRQSHYGMVAKPIADNPGWKLEMLEGNAWNRDDGDIRIRQCKPVGVAFRIRF